jgi:hypothetical protein
MSVKILGRLFAIHWPKAFIGRLGSCVVETSLVWSYQTPT